MALSGILLVEEMRTSIHVGRELSSVPIGPSVVFAALHSCRPSSAGVSGSNEVSQVKGCALRLEFLEPEPKKCKLSPRCSMAHQDKAFI